MLGAINAVRYYGAQLMLKPIRDALRATGLVPHLAPTPLIATADATALASVQTLANAIKVAYNAHLASTAYHTAADATNTITSADATNQATSNTLLNEIKTDLSAHIALTAAHGTVAGQGTFALATVTTADATDEATSVTLANAIKAAANRHFSAGIQQP